MASYALDYEDAKRFAQKLHTKYVRQKEEEGRNADANAKIVDAFAKLSTRATPGRATSVSLAIPVDGPTGIIGHEGARNLVGDLGASPESTPKRLRRRDSLDRRESLLKGEEGSRRRRRWENAHLIGNQFAQPPLPIDWEVRPAHPIRVVPYALAALWDARQEEQQRRAVRRTSAIKESVAKTVTVVVAPRVPRSLRAKLKRSHGSKSLLQELEDEVRKFVQTWKDADEKRKRSNSTATTASSAVEDEDEEEEFVLVRPPSAHSIDSDYVDLGPHPEREKLVFHSLEENQAAAFGRYLVHSLGRYYDLDTYSITTGKPARREAYVVIKDAKFQDKAPQLPRPLYGLV